VGGGGLAWALLVGVMTEAGFSGNTRYLVLPAAVGLVIGAAGLVWLARLALAGARRSRALQAVGAGVLAAAFTSAGLDALPGVAERAERQSRLIPELEAVVADAGGAAHLRGCGSPSTSRFFVPAVAWRLGLPLREVRHVPARAGAVLQLHLESRPRHWSPRLRRPAGRLVGARGSWRVWLDCSRGRTTAERARTGA
jgi:hypothetical protein